MFKKLESLLLLHFQIIVFILQTYKTCLFSEKPEEHIICEFEGFIRNPFDCTSFYICVADLNGGLVPKLFQCPMTLYWDQERKSCNYPDQVQCNIG